MVHQKNPSIFIRLIDRSRRWVLDVVRFLGLSWFLPLVSKDRRKTYESYIGSVKISLDSKVFLTFLHLTSPNLERAWHLFKRACMYFPKRFMPKLGFIGHNIKPYISPLSLKTIHSKSFSKFLNFLQDHPKISSIAKEGVS